MQSSQMISRLKEAIVWPRYLKWKILVGSHFAFFRSVRLFDISCVGGS